MAERHDGGDARGAAHRADPTRAPFASDGQRYLTEPGGGGRRTGASGSFRASLGWAVAGSVVPGLGLTRTRWRPWGLAMIALVVLVLIGGGLLALAAPQLVLSTLVMPGVLTGLWVAVAAFGVLWAGSILATHLLLRPSPPRWWQRALGSALVGVLALAVAVPSFAGARAIHDTSLLIDDVFGAESAPVDQDDEPFGTVVDPWANKPRLNVLVLGGDAGADRTGTRTDTVILASIDTRSGDMVLFSMPRQTQRIPFPPGSKLAARWPRGFTNGVLNDQAYALNAIYDTVPALAPDALPAGVEDPGAEALKLGVGTALGLQVDYYAMVNMEGFVEFVNALGGITVNINEPVPVGGKNPTYIGGSDGFPPDRWLVPGPDQQLNGSDALWFARGRYRTDDYNRMSRQRCVIQAVVTQANPTTVLANYEALSKAGREIVSSDVPNRRLPAMLTLALRVKDGAMTSVSFENGKDGFSTANPDWTVVRQRVQQALTPPRTPTPAPSAPAEVPTADPTTPAASEPPVVAPSATPTAGTPSVPSSLVDECAYHPVPYPGLDG